MGEKYIIIKKGDVQINLYVDIDLDDIIINKQELFEVFKEAGFEIEEGQDITLGYYRYILKLSRV